ncbi:NUC173 domain-containing protein [Citrus sinensis]|uniref:NUC173 domain-containing protein n=1 Tax=Citrus sinensis TaxID=2711 RepID=A0ACB8HWW5_CITSI|nr:NUC173 domain-containing protein [Citrus sinensis]
MDQSNELTTETETENEKLQFKADTDICQQLMDRYATSAAPQHRHLVATAAAMRSILTSESLPLIASAYFAAAISSLESATLDSTEVSALLTFLSIAVALVPEQGIAESKASVAVELLVGVLERDGSLGVATVKCVVKCLGVLLVSFCDLEDWGSVKLGFETLLKFSIDKRPKVRRCAQDCLEKVLKSFQSSTVIKAASKLINSLFEKYIPLAITLRTSGTVDGSKDETLLKPDHLEVLYMLNVVNLIVPHLSVKVRLKILSELCKLMTSEFSPLTRHIFKGIEAFVETSRVEVVIPEMENTIVSLASYVSLKKRNPVDTVMTATILLKSCMEKLLNGETRSLWTKNVPLVFGALAGLLTSEASITLQASAFVKELISQLADVKTNEILSFEDGDQENDEARAIKSICAIFEDAIGFDSIPNEHILAVISLLFLKLGEISYIFMKRIVLKLADLLTLASVDMATANHLQHCIGSAVIAMGPERILTLLPISLNADDFTCSNVWLVPILKNHVIGASLGYYMEHIVPLAKTFQRASRIVKKSITGQDLQAHAQELWGLLPAFCGYPTDTRQNFRPLAKLLITLIKKDPSMHENIAVALQVLVNQNRNALTSRDNLDESIINEAKDTVLGIRSVSSYTKKAATKNIRVLALCSNDLLKALADLFIDSQHEKCSYLKVFHDIFTFFYFPFLVLLRCRDAIGCLASITDSSITQNIFSSLLKRFHIVNGEGEFEMLGSHIDNLTDEEHGNPSASEICIQRSVIMELASSFVGGAKGDLVDLIYNFIRHTLEEHAWFCSSRYEELIDLLLGVKSPVDVASLGSRFACLHILLVHTLKMSLEEENTKAFLILNEIIVTLKDAKEGPRKAAYDVLLLISSSLRDSSCVNPDAPFYKLVNMILGYLSGSSPHIKSGAVSALSMLVYQDPDICISKPDLVHSLLSLLKGKAAEVIKAVLGFVKVMVSSLLAKDMQNLLADVISEVLPWSTVSRNHFRSKVTVILEIMIRKCGFAAVQSVTPDKYRRFLKTVLENRQNKSGPKEVGTGTETVTSDSPAKWPHRKKRKEMDVLSENGGVLCRQDGSLLLRRFLFIFTKTKGSSDACSSPSHNYTKDGRDPLEFLKDGLLQLHIFDALGEG